MRICSVKNLLWVIYLTTLLYQFVTPMVNVRPEWLKQENYRLDFYLMYLQSWVNTIILKYLFKHFYNVEVQKISLCWDNLSKLV